MAGFPKTAVRAVATRNEVYVNMLCQLVSRKTSCLFPNLVAVILVVCSFGCATGPIRYKTLGRYKYATVEFTERVHPLAKPLAAVGGVFVDGAIVVADTLTVPLVSIPIGVKTAVLGPCPELRDFKNHPIKETSLSVLMFPIYLPWSFCLNLYFQSYEPAGTPYFDYFYPGLYGEEASYFADVPDRQSGNAGGKGDACECPKK